jgi:hypothetical protein
MRAGSGTVSAGLDDLLMLARGLDLPVADLVAGETRPPQ